QSIHILRSVRQQQDEQGRFSICSRQAAVVQRDAYCNRNVVERCFGRLKEYRRIATRYDKTARNYLAMVKLGCIRLFYQRLRN
ncbi:IS5/IS1182 family transposase, partial [Shigella sonnei]